MRITLKLIAVAGGILIATVSTPSVAADSPAAPNPNQATIDQINQQKALLTAQDELLKLQAALIKDASPSLGDNFGKKGALTIESAERDKFHVTARSAAAFAGVADELAQRVKADPGKGPIVILVDVDRAAFQVYWNEKFALDGLDARIRQVLKKPAAAQAQALGMTVFAVGTALAQLAQLPQLFRADKSVAFTDSLLPDELLLDLLALRLPADRVKYPSGEFDSIMAKDFTSRYVDKLKEVLDQRSALVGAGDAGKDALEELKALSTRLAASDATTKVPGLLTVLRGEIVANHVAKPDARTLSIKVASKGGASLKTSSIWRSDRLYASGGLIVSYRLADASSTANVLQAGVVSVESGFARIRLDE